MCHGWYGIALVSPLRPSAPSALSAALRRDLSARAAPRQRAAAILFRSTSWSYRGRPNRNTLLRSNAAGARATPQIGAAAGKARAPRSCRVNHELGALASHVHVLCVVLNAEDTNVGHLPTRQAGHVVCHRIDVAMEASMHTGKS